MAVTARQAANKICELSDWTVSNLQLQKILYIAHMVYFGDEGKPLISDEKFESLGLRPCPTVNLS